MHQKQWVKYVVLSVWVFSFVNGLCRAKTVTVGPTDQYHFKTLCEGIAAADRGDTVLVADGVYQGDYNRYLSINAQNITLKSLNGPENCIIDCQDQGPALLLLCGSEECIVDGFTFTRGANRQGGAILIKQPDLARKAPIISHCLFQSNNATEEDGGAIYIYIGEAVIIDCTFIDNQAADDGGAIAIRGGIGYNDFATNEVHLVDCSFINNHSRDNGGALFARLTHLTVNRCFIGGNSATSNGGAVYVREGSPVFLNTVFSGNHAHNRGGVLYLRQSVEGPALLFCTLSGNSAGLAGAAIATHSTAESLHMLGCIAWDNTIGSDPFQQFTEVEPGRFILQDCWIQDVNQVASPMFAGADGMDNTIGTLDDNFRLLPESPCIDASHVNTVSWGMQTDCDNHNRLQGSSIDIGAYEYGAIDTDPNGKWNSQPVLITELLANTHHGNNVDWIELHNTTHQSIDISGWWVADETRCRQEFIIPQGTSIEPDSYLVFDRNSFSFGLNDYGESLTLCSRFAGFPSGYHHTITFPPSLPNVSLLRHVDSVGLVEYVSSAQNTPGMSNAMPMVGPIVISEIMIEPMFDVTKCSYIELANISDSPVDLTNNLSHNPWRLECSSGLTFLVDRPITLPPGGVFLVTNDPNLLLVSYPVIPESVPVLGPWEGGLSSLGGSIAVKQYQSPASISDRVNYGSAHIPTQRCGPSYWPETSLQSDTHFTRRDLYSYGNDPNNWAVSPPTPGCVNPVVE